MPADRPNLTVISGTGANVDDVRSAEVTRALTPPPAEDDRGSPARRATVAPGGSAVVRIAVVAAVSLAGALALGPRLVRGDLPVDDAALGTAARGVVKADRDYALVDEAATAESRARAMATALPVWDLDDDRARRDAQVLQKALVRTAVAIEAARQRSEPRPSPRDSGDAFLRPLDDVRAVVAGELADVGLEAPRDDEWRAIASVLWFAPSTVDAVVPLVSAAFTDPILNAPAGAPIERDAALRIRALRTQEEQTVDAKDVVNVDVARLRLEKSLATSIAELAPAQAPTGWPTSVGRTASWLAGHLEPNLTWNAAETEARRRSAADRVPPVIVRAFRGETVLRPGELITPRHQLLVSAMAVQQADELRTRATVGTGAFVLLVCATIYLFGARRVFQRRLNNRDVLFLGTLIVVELGLLLLADLLSPLVVAAVPGVHAAMLAYALPVAFGPMAVRLTLPPDVALLFALVVALLGGVVVEGGMGWATASTLGAMGGVAVVTGSPRRLTLLFAGLVVGVIAASATLTLELFRGALGGWALGVLLAANVIGGLLSGLIAVVFIPIVERVFGYVTDQRLYRLADLNSPLLKDLIVHAPGTWHHSVRVAVLAEHAAQAIGANALLARVMSLYHDIGKIARPQSFRENQTTGENPHDRLSPEESATVLRGHVLEGLSLAREHGLPDAVACVIEEHHADSVMEQFLEKAHRRARDNGQGEGVVDERAFRYGGRRPQSRESALVTLADHIESAARGLRDDVTASRLRDIVDAFVNRALTSDLLAACDVSLRDLERARAALKDALIELHRAELGRAPGPTKGNDT